jgi:hypothetical protein
MKKTFSILFIMFSMSLYAQGNILSGYSFEDGNYVLYGWPLYGACKQKTIVDSLDRWYINDNQAIKEIATLWKLKEKPEFDLLKNNYDYEIYLYKDKLRIETFLVNSQNWILYHKNKSYYFGLDYLRLIAKRANKQRTFSSRLYRPYDSTETYHREDYDSAVAFYNSCLKDPSVMFIMKSNVPYGEFEGDFMFSYTPKKSEVSLAIDDLEKKLTNLIKSKYKVDKLHIEFEEINEGQFYFWISCDKKLFDIFNLFPKVDWMDDKAFWNYQTYRTMFFPVNQTPAY